MVMHFTPQFCYHNTVPRSPSHIQDSMGFSVSPGMHRKSFVFSVNSLSATIWIVCSISVKCFTMLCSKSMRPKLHILCHHFAKDLHDRMMLVSVSFIKFSVDMQLIFMYIWSAESFSSG